MNTAWVWNQSAIREERRQIQASGFVYSPQARWGESWENVQIRHQFKKIKGLNLEEWK